MTGDPGKRTRVLIVSLPGMMQNLLRETFTIRADAEVVGVASGRGKPVDLATEAGSFPYPQPIIGGNHTTIEQERQRWGRFHSPLIFTA
jgi:hypothetical protein